MPGRLFLTTPSGDVAAQAGVADVAPEEPPRRNVKPGEDVLTLTKGQGLSRMRWGLIPSGRVNARGRPVLETIVNARSETVFGKSAFEGVTRAVVPADGWYEWTGTRGRKTPWRIQSKSGNLLWFAAICDLWTAPGGREIWQVATITCPPNADVRDIHDRMGVLLSKEDVWPWLEADTEDAVAFLRTPADGSLTVEPAGDVNWDAP